MAEYTYVISGCSRTEVNGEYVQQGKFCNQRPIFYCVAGADWTGMLRSWCSMEKRWNFKWADVMYLFLLLLLLLLLLRLLLITHCYFVPDLLFTFIVSVSIKEMDSATHIIIDVITGAMDNMIDSMFFFEVGIITLTV